MANKRGIIAPGIWLWAKNEKKNNSRSLWHISVGNMRACGAALRLLRLVRYRDLRHHL